MELMIVVAIISVIAGIMLPIYRSHAAKSNRAAAEAYILSVANKQEQYMLDARTYADSLGALLTTTPPEVAKNYTISISNVGTAPPTYTVVATPTGGQAVGDTKCGSVSIDQAGTKAITGTGTVQECW